MLRISERSRWKSSSIFAFSNRSRASFQVHQSLEHPLLPNTRLDKDCTRNALVFVHPSSSIPSCRWVPMGNNFSFSILPCSSRSLSSSKQKSCPAWHWAERCCEDCVRRLESGEIRWMDNLVGMIQALPTARDSAIDAGFLLPCFNHSRSFPLLYGTSNDFLFYSYFLTADPRVGFCFSTQIGHCNNNNNSNNNNNNYVY